MSAAARLTEVTLQTIKEKYLKNLEVIDRLYEEKCALEEVVGDLAERRQEREIATEDASFQPWWEYEEGPEEGGQLLSAAAAAAKLFGEPVSKRVSTAVVGLSRHLQADADKYLARQLRIDDAEAREAGEQRAYDEAQVERRRLSAAASVGAFRGLERREKQAQQNRQCKQEQKQQAAEEAKANEARQRALLHADSSRDRHGKVGAIPWEMLEQNAETQRRERIEVRKMHTYAESKAPKAAKLRAPPPPPEPFDTLFTAPDPSRVMTQLEQKKIAFGRKLDDSRAAALLARQEAEAIRAKRAAKQQDLSLSGHAKRLSKEHRGRRLQQAELSEIAEAKRSLLQQKREIEGVLNDTFTAVTGGRRLNNAAQLRAALVRGAIEKEQKLHERTRPIGQDESRPARRPVSAREREASKKEREWHSKEEGEEKIGKEQGEASDKWRMDEEDDEDRAVYERARAARQGGARGVLTPRTTLIERHEATTARQQAADMALGISGRRPQQ